MDDRWPNDPGAGCANLLNPATGNKTQLTSPEREGVAFNPSSCPNGRYFVFSRGGTNTFTIWRMDASGGNLR